MPRSTRASDEHRIFWHLSGIANLTMLPAESLNPMDFSFLDQSEFKSKYASGPRQSEMKFYVGGIRCAKCVRKLEDLPLKVGGLRRFQVEMGKNLAHIEIDPTRLCFSRVADEIRKAGFHPIPLTLEVSFEVARKSEDRLELIRLGVAGMAAGNIMTFSFANYLGATPEWQLLFSWLSFALYLPVVTFVAWPFYRGAWQSLKQRQLSIDLPMTIASFSGFAFSVVELMRGQSDVYFDSLSGFLFLILVSRFFQRRLQQEFLRPQELTESLQLQRVRRVEGPDWRWRPLDDLHPGDRFLLLANETVPAEAELESFRAHFSLAWISGESKAQAFIKGATVPAGSRLVGGEARLVCRRRLRETGFGQILQEVQKFSLSRNRTVISADRWAQWLLATVFLVALVFLIAYWSVSPEEAVRRSLSLIILACPCAMAFGTPLALAASLRLAQRAGLVIRDANVFEAARFVRTLFFDKTGTLTETELSLNENPDSVPGVYQKVVLSLENDSLHPIAFAFRKAFSIPENLPPTEAPREIPGLGVSGYLFGRYYELKRSPFKSETTSCTLFEDEKPVMSFTFSARLKTDCAETLDLLRQHGYRLVLVSGDKAEAVIPLAKQLGFEENEIHHSLSPGDKAELIQQTRNAAMIGDGVNDSLALMAADVGIAVSGGVEAALKSAQVYCSHAGVRGILDLFNISRQAYALIHQNLTISVIYNIIGAALALGGVINPFVAAVLMPVSSGFILLTTWLRGRL
jgi:Cu+-exporting ATPase